MAGWGVKLGALKINEYIHTFFFKGKINFQFQIGISAGKKILIG